MGTQLYQKEQELLVLEIVEACIKYGNENKKSFEEVLNEVRKSQAKSLKCIYKVKVSANHLNSNYKSTVFQTFGKQERVKGICYDYSRFDSKNEKGRKYNPSWMCFRITGLAKIE